MKQHSPFDVLLGVIFALALALNASAALVTVSSTETWDGVNNPHAADGVTISGSGTDADPFTYNIPNGMLVTSTGKIVLHSAGDYSIKLVIQGGDLQMDAGAVLNTERYAIRTGLRFFTLDLSGINSITGAGTIGPITTRDSTIRDLTIQNVNNVSLANIDMHVENANTGPAEFRNISITASGAVVVTGTVDNSDRDSGGDGCGDITIKANTIDVNNIDARGFRNDPGGRDPYSGNVALQALSPPGNYDLNDGVNNASTNRLTVRGAIRTFAVDPETIGGNVTLQSVVLQLVFGVIEVPPSAAKTLQVGLVQNGASADDLFVDVSGSGQAVDNVVQWGGTWTPPAGGGPSFASNPVMRANATALAAYAQTLVGTATDPDSGPLTFGRALSGPAWLQVASNGALSGTPALTDSCTNTWLIYATDGTRFGVATLQIFVDAPPRWNDGDANFAYDNATQNVPYANTLATNVIYCGAQTLTFAKVSGPAWLNVASDGTLSGTPDPTNVLNNAFGVTASDGTTDVPATLNIFVNGSPTFPINPFPRATAFVSQGDYAVRSQTLAGAATDPQDPANPNTLAWTTVSGPAWLKVASDGSLSGTPTAGDIGINSFTVSAARVALGVVLGILQPDKPRMAAFLLFVALGFGLSAAPPNVVLIISDDQHWSDYGFMGHSTIQTPHLDRLSKEGLTFRRGYVPASLCCPSLASIITGRYPHEHLITGNDPPRPVGMPDAQFYASDAFKRGRQQMAKNLEAWPTLPCLLGQAGYRSLQTGKWWLGDCKRGGFTEGMTKGGRHGDEGLEIGRKTMQPIYDFIAQSRKDLADASAVAARRTIYGECFTHDFVDLLRAAPNLRWRWILEDGWKLILPALQNEKGVPELYYLIDDPREERNLAGTEASRVAALRAKLDAKWPATETQRSTSR